MERARPIALITGASSGIGAAFADELATREHDLILVARRQDRLEALARALQETENVSVECMVADLTRDADVKRVADRVRGEERLEILVNNAGFGTTGFFFEADPAGQENMHRLHVLATVILTRAALGAMVQRNRGAIINVSSVAAFIPSGANVSYNSTKAWMNIFTESINLELRAADSPVRVQALCPGFTITEFHEKLGIDRTKIFPRSGFWMPAEKVVRDSLAGLQKGDWLVVPGWRYKLLVFALRHLPRLVREHAALVYSRKARGFVKSSGG
ncbi:MAG: SDR family oxidoreductase [Acidobacteria bacterium]|nr:MAG: SDR family oxidoreductase [Acidobacteriota bacterium]